MTRHCKCEKWNSHCWEGNYHKLGDKNSSFLFCPWCGVRLIAPCHTCGIPSNEHTGNTLYWYEDKDFCGAKCSLDFSEKLKKLDMKFAKKENE